MVDRSDTDEFARKKREPIANDQTPSQADTHGFDQDLTSSANTEFPQINQYQLVSLLGSGGMGIVYKAYDSILKRHVALKLLKTEDPELSQRFLKEAQIQAMVDHESVCKIFEIGKIDGKHFIVMQLIQGETLLNSIQTLNLEEKLRVMIQVSEAVNAAHRLGLIHRDLKPGNIMLEKKEDAEWKPFVLDFGLARHQESSGITLTGVVMGTPPYMAPEQVRGQVRQLDERTDVYSLGATLFELLTGRAPFLGASGAEILLKVLDQDPPEVRKLNPEIPHELQTIVTKCMEKDPVRRYTSAKTLALDLQRYLDGEPITARPAGWSYKMSKKIRKNKAAAVILATALLVTLILSITFLWAQWWSLQENQYSNEFGQQMRVLESRLMSAYMAPAHDLRSELSESKQTLMQIKKTIEEAGSPAERPGHFALGRGYLALGEYKTAAEHLYSAWNAGYRGKSIAYSLGLALGSRYQQEVDASAHSGIDYRTSRKPYLEKELRDPALNFLGMARTESESPAYVEGLIALLDEKFDYALKKSYEASAAARWSYAAMKLRGDVHLARARLLCDAGDYKGAILEFEEAEAEYKRAAELGRSDENVYLNDCKQWYGRMRMEARIGASVDRSFEQVIKSCELAILINPDNGNGYHLKSVGHMSYGLQKENTGKDPLGDYQKSLHLAGEALKRNPGDLQSLLDRGYTNYLIGSYRVSKGKDPVIEFQQAMQDFQSAASLVKDSGYPYYMTGMLYMSQSEHAEISNKNPIDPIKKAISNLQRTLDLTPNFVIAHARLGDCFVRLGVNRARHGQDPRSDYQSSVQYYQKALNQNPRDFFVLLGMKDAYSRLAEYENKQGMDPHESCNKAIQFTETASKINPKSVRPYAAMGSVYLILAEHENDRGLDPRSNTGKAVVAFEQVLKIKGPDLRIYNSLAIAYAIDVIYLAEHGINPHEAVLKTEQAVKQCFQILPDLYAAHLTLGIVKTSEARWAIKNGASGEALFSKGKRHLMEALKRNPENAGIYGELARFYFYQAEANQKRKNPSNEQISEGLRMSVKALSLNPDDPGVIADQGRLYLLQAKNESEARMRIASAERAKERLQRALKSKPFTNWRYESYLREAEEWIKRK